VRVAFIFYLIFFSNALTAQLAISGKIKDNRGRPVPGASIAIKDAYDGGTSDSTGHFQFKTSEKGAQLLTVSCIGFRPFEQPVNLAGASLVLAISLKEEPNELKAVTITAGAFAAGDSKRGAVLSSLDIATTAGSNADITAALKTLPGTQQVGEQEGLFVRGGAGYEAKQFIDGTLVNNPYYSSVPDIAQRGRFSPFLFKGTVFSTGGYSALYGQALSSVLLLESIDLPEKSEVDASVSPLFAGIGTQQLSNNKKSSWGINYGYTNVGLYFKAVKQSPDYFKIPQFHSGDANFRFKTKRGGMVKYYTTFGHSQLGLRRPDIDSNGLKDAFSLKNTSWYNNLSWREYLGRGWKMNLGGGFSTNKDDIIQQLQNAADQPQPVNNAQFWLQGKNFVLGNRQDLSQVKLVLDKKLGAISSIRFGGEFQHSFNSTRFNDTLRKLIDNYSAAFAETDIYISNGLAAKLGVRAENSSAIHTAALAPRVSLAYKTSKDAQLSVAYGIFYQRPENLQLFYTSALGFTKATHYILNYQKMTPERVFRVEAYYKKYEDLVKTIPVNYYYSAYDNSGSGYAKGVELFWRDKKTIKNFDYWISYSYVDTKRNYLNYTELLRPNFAATHTASVVTKRFFTTIKTGFNLTYSYATGRPYYNFMVSNTGNKYVIADRGTTKDYHSLNFSTEYVPSAGKTNAKSFIVWFASISNVLGYKPVFNYNYSYNGMVKQPVTLPANRFYFVGCFISWGVDRSQDAINNNL
jgi:vitamin B12 transporter